MYDSVCGEFVTRPGLMPQRLPRSAARCRES